jgi:hypothetical protein
VVLLGRWHKALGAAAMQQQQRRGLRKLWIGAKAMQQRRQWQVQQQVEATLLRLARQLRKLHDGSRGWRRMCCAGLLIWQ